MAPWRYIVFWLALACSPCVWAANSTWDGGNASGNPKNLWSQGNNWTANSTPAANSTIYMQGTTRTLNEVDAGVWQAINGLTFSNSTAAFTIYGAALTNGAIGITNFHNMQVTISNTFVLSASQTWYSPSNILFMAGPVNLQANTLTVSGATVTNKITGVVSGTGAITKTGTGQLELSGVNTYSGITTINGGTVSIGADSGLGTSPGSAVANQITMGGGTLQTTATFTLNSNRGITLNAGGGTLDVVSGTTLTYNGSIAGASGNNLTKTGSGNLVLGGANTYSGKTIINAGTISIAADNGLGTSPNSAVADQVTLNGGTLQTTATFALNSNRGITLGASGGTIDTSSGTILTYNGIIGGSGNLTITGSGTLALGGANTFSGTATISGGTVQLNATSALGNVSGVTLNTGGTLLLGAAATIKDTAGITFAGGTLNANDQTETMGTLTLQSDSIIDLSTGGASGLLTFADTSYSGGTLTINNWHGIAGQSGTDDRIFFTSNSAGTAFLFYNIQFTGYGSGAARLANGEIVPIPEPTNILSGLLLFVLIARSYFQRRI